MKKRILHVLNTSSYSGAENVAISIINNTKNEVDAIYSSLNGDILFTLEKNKIHFCPFNKLTILNLKKIIKECEPDVIHAHDFTATIISVLCFSKIKIVSHIHNNVPWIKKRGIYSFLFLIISLFVDTIMTVSRSIENEYVFTEFIKHKIICISNPIDVKKIKDLSNEENKIEEYDVVFLGRLTESKNPNLLFNIIEKSVQINCDIKVVIIGEGDLFSDFKEKVLKSKISKNVKMYGFLDNPYPILKKCKVLCLPSKWEGFGLVAVEALALGVPVVCSGVGGLNEIVTDQCGKKCGQVDDYVIEIIELITNDVYWQNKHKKALEHAFELDNTKTYYKKILDTYLK